MCHLSCNLVLVWSRHVTCLMSLGLWCLWLSFGLLHLPFVSYIRIHISFQNCTTSFEFGWWSFTPLRFFSCMVDEHQLLWCHPLLVKGTFYTHLRCFVRTNLPQCVHMSSCKCKWSIYPFHAPVLCTSLVCAASIWLPCLEVTHMLLTSVGAFVHWWSPMHYSIVLSPICMSPLWCEGLNKNVLCALGLPVFSCSIHWPCVNVPLCQCWYSTSHILC